MPTKREISFLDATSIGRRIRRLRRRWGHGEGLTQRELGVKAGIDPGTLSMIELGLRLPTLNQAVSLSWCLKRTLQYILSGTRKGDFWLRYLRDRVHRDAETDGGPGLGRGRRTLAGGTTPPGLFTFRE
jgi:DNA-binding XRE family transcriptional regulator